MGVVKLDVPNLRDVPQMLRKLADDIESGKQPQSRHTIVVNVTPDGGLVVYGFGDVETLPTEVGLLHLAALKISIE